VEPPSGDLHELALAMAHWVEAAFRHPADPVAGSRALDEARRRLNGLAREHSAVILSDDKASPRRWRPFRQAK
jgi:hypothetical protein